jgi:hypothetical protein
MFMRRRRPLLGAAMIGGAGYMAGKAGQRNQYREADQEQRLEELESQPPAPAPAPAPAAAPAPAGGGNDLVSKLQQLAELQKSGVLSQEEFDAAKQKLLAG